MVSGRALSGMDEFASELIVRNPLTHLLRKICGFFPENNGQKED